MSNGFDWRKINELDLDLENMGNWPAAVKVVFAGIVAVLTGAAFYFLLISDQLSVLTKEKDREAQLRQEFPIKYYQAANIEEYRKQMTEMETTFANALRVLPESHETPGLLDDITYVGTAHGLEFLAINWERESPQEFYIELPISMVVQGGYHQLGAFVSDVAALPRIVTLHDFSISTEKDDLLRMTLQAKTYRYKEKE